MLREGPPACIVRPRTRSHGPASSGRTGPPGRGAGVFTDLNGTSVSVPADELPFAIPEAARTDPERFPGATRMMLALGSSTDGIPDSPSGPAHPNIDGSGVHIEGVGPRPRRGVTAVVAADARSVAAAPGSARACAPGPRAPSAGQIPSMIPLSVALGRMAAALSSWLGW